MRTCTRDSACLRVAYDVFSAAVSEEVAGDGNANAVNGRRLMGTFTERDCLVQANGMLNGVNA